MDSVNHYGASPFEPIVVTESAYYNDKDTNYKCVAWGTDRRLEIILSIGYALGLEFDEIKQNYKWVQW